MKKQIKTEITYMRLKKPNKVFLCNVARINGLTASNWLDLHLDFTRTSFSIKDGAKLIGEKTRDRVQESKSHSIS